MTTLIRYLQSSDIPKVKQIADANRESLSFLTKSKFKELAEQQRGIVAEEDGQILGFVTFRHRKSDLQTTLSEICVEASRRNQGIGRLLLNALLNDSKCKARSFIQLKCPKDLAANDFYAHLGFKLDRIEQGKARQLNVWRLDLS